MRLTKNFVTTSMEFVLDVEWSKFNLMKLLKGIKREQWCREEYVDF